MSTSDNTTTRVVVTGGCGFIGSNLIHYLLRNHPDWDVVNFDSLTYAADQENLAGLENEPRYRFLQLDITDRDAVRNALRELNPDGIFHLAAESHVDNSIRGPEQFVLTNVIGTFNLLEEARQLWGADTRKRFLHVSTDEVYGSLGATGAFSETTQYAPNSPYSASKAGSDHLVRAWHHTYGMNVVITNCSNNYGPRQHREKLIPTVIATALRGDAIPVYGQGVNVRDWLYVIDHCEAIDKVFAGGRSGESYVIGGRNEWRNIDLVRSICALLDEEIGGGPAGRLRKPYHLRDRPAGARCPLRDRSGEDRERARLVFGHAVPRRAPRNRSLVRRKGSRGGREV